MDWPYGLVACYYCPGQHITVVNTNYYYFENIQAWF